MGGSGGIPSGFEAVRDASLKRALPKGTSDRWPRKAPAEVPVIASRSQTRRLPLRRGQQVSLEQLDQLLDVPNDRWERTVRKLLKEFRTKDLGFDLPASRVSELDTSENRAWTTHYASQVQLLPRMDRAEEFLMARRYEFARARAAQALESLGLVEDEVVEILAPMHAKRFEHRAAMSAVAVAYAERALDELERLRNLYVEGALYIVMGLVHRYRGLGVDEADLVQEGNASLFQAIDGFDWRRDVRFKTYGQYWVHQAVLKTLYNASRTIRIPIWVQKAYRKIQRAQRDAQRMDGSEVSTRELAERLDMPEERIEEILSVKRYAVSLDAAVGSQDDEATLAQLIPDVSQQPVHQQVQDGDLGGRIAEVMSDLPERERMILERRFGLDGKEPETLADIAGRLGVTAERVRQLQKAAIGRLQKPRKLDRLRAFA